MVDAKIQRDLLGCSRALSPDQQRRVLRFAYGISGTLGPGKPGSELVRHAGSLAVGDADRMEKVIEEGCEQVDDDDWHLPT